MTDAAKQHKTRQNRPRNWPKIILSCMCRRATVAQLVAEGCSTPCRPATGRRRPRRQRHEFEHPVAVAVAHEFESSVSCAELRIPESLLRF
ncbi:hypothetical protein L596_002993 [Steinernema carpocapsae]|uniref:Uncharacterized protein n=1 Tax=Steinernema carpocapsae TaxID=34508 RepID=A0A4V6I7L3_STECR|nr:hypothetical protein L596_002993 [Steinernema carpocapsae]